MASTPRIDELRKKFDENPRRYFAPLANEYRKAGDIDQAIFICQEYLPQQPGHMSGHIVYGQALYEAHRHAEARAVFETALSLDPENLIALRHLGDIARELGDVTTARTWYERVLDADPRNEEIGTLLRSLGQASGGGAAAAGSAPVDDRSLGAPAYGDMSAAASGVGTSAPSELAEMAEDLQRSAGEAPLPAPAWDAAPQPEAIEETLDFHTSDFEIPAAAAPSAAPSAETQPAAAGEAMSFGSESLELEMPPLEMGASGSAASVGMPMLDVHEPDMPSVSGAGAEPPPLDLSHLETPASPSDREAGLPSEPATAAAGGLAGLEPTSFELRPSVAVEMPTESLADDFDALFDAPPSAPAAPAHPASAVADAMSELPEAVSAGEPPASEPAVVPEADFDFTPQPPPQSAAEPETISPEAAEPVAPSAESPSWGPDAGEQTTPSSPAPAFLTETMAELFVQQGHLEQAIGVYRALAGQRPDDETLRIRLSELESALRLSSQPTPVWTPAADAETPVVASAAVEAPAMERAPTIRDFLGAIAAWRATPGGDESGESQRSDSVEPPGEASLDPEADGPLEPDTASVFEAQEEPADASAPVIEAPAADDVAAPAHSEAAPWAEEAPPALTGLPVDVPTDVSDEAAAAPSEALPSFPVVESDSDAVPTASPSAESPHDSVGASIGVLFAGAETRAAEPEPPSSAESAPPSIPEAPPAVTPEAGADALPGRPARTASTELSLDAVFKRRPSQSIPAAPPGFSIDQFFSREAVQESAPGGEPAREPASGTTDDLEQFNAWLEGLKKT